MVNFWGGSFHSNRPGMKKALLARASKLQGRRSLLIAQGPIDSRLSSGEAIARTGLGNTTFAEIEGLVDFAKPDRLLCEYTALDIWPGIGDGTFSTITGWRRGFRRIGSGRGFPPRCVDQRKQSDILLTPWGIASVKVMRIPCSGRRITMGRASMVWSGTRRKSYFRSRTLRIMRICSMA